VSLLRTVLHVYAIFTAVKMSADAAYSLIVKYVTIGWVRVRRNGVRMSFRPSRPRFFLCVSFVQRSPSGKDRRGVPFNPANSAFWKRLAHLLNAERSGECAFWKRLARLLNTERSGECVCMESISSIATQNLCVCSVGRAALTARRNASARY